MSEEYWNHFSNKELYLKLQSICDLLLLTHNCYRKLTSMGFIDLIKRKINLLFRMKFNSDKILMFMKEIGLDHPGLIENSLNNLLKRLEERFLYD